MDQQNGRDASVDRRLLFGRGWSTWKWSWQGQGSCDFVVGDAVDAVYGSIWGSMLASGTFVMFWKEGAKSESLVDGGSKWCCEMVVVLEMVLSLSYYSCSPDFFRSCDKIVRYSIQYQPLDRTSH